PEPTPEQTLDPEPKPEPNIETPVTDNPKTGDDSYLIYFYVSILSAIGLLVKLCRREINL
ncbi:MAG: hypothetical protein IJH34_13940, partial [Romboutsia sp.]|nr:hypothetical protein [Romboutsia sp.]